MLDIADLHRHDITLDIAFGAAKEAEKSSDSIDRLTRRRAAKLFRQRGVIPSMIDKIKTLITPESDYNDSRAGRLMPMVVIITRDVEARYRGFIGSAMLELGPGVYAHPTDERGCAQTSMVGP